MFHFECVKWPVDLGGWVVLLRVVRGDACGVRGRSGRDGDHRGIMGNTGATGTSVTTVADGVVDEEDGEDGRRRGRMRSRGILA